jgi:hypothetical protein
MSRHRDTAWRVGGQADGDYEQAQGAEGRAGNREPVGFDPDEDKSGQGHSRTDDDVAATGAVDAAEAVLEVAAGQIVVDGLVNDRAPWAITLRIPRGIFSAEQREGPFQQVV